MESEFEHCGRCGRLADAFAMDKAISCSSSYCDSCMRELHEELQGRKRCSLCRCAIWDWAPKFVMPSRLYSGYFFDRLPVGNRLMCASCCKSVERLGIMKDPLAKLGSIRTRLGRAKLKSTYSAKGIGSTI